MSVRACPHCGCEIEDRRRSTRANRYWYGAVVKTFQDIWSRGRVAADLPPYTKEQVHDTLVRVLVGEVEGPLGHKEPAPTKVMDSHEFWTLTEKARHMAFHDYGMNIPTPEEWREDAAA